MQFEHALEKLEFNKIQQRLLRYASSDPGREVLQSIPISTSLSEIRLELKRVSELKKLLEVEESIPLEGIHQVREAIQRASVQGTTLQPKELGQILATLRSARVLRQFLSKRTETYPLLWEIAEKLHTNQVLEYNLDQTVDETGAIRASASKELRRIRQTIAEAYEQLKSLLANILKSVSEHGFTQDEIITTREGRMVIPVKIEHKNRVQGFIHSASASGATVFIEPSETLNLNNEIRSLHLQEQREIERILRVLTEQVSTFCEQMLANSLRLGQLDALNAKAKYSIEILGVEPQVTQWGSIRLRDARHPILLQTHARNGTVPLDIELGSRYNTLIISGPNAGGKTVAIKCVGLLALMTQCGLHIPVSEESVLRIFDKIFVEIGDEQSIENDLSTFSSHLKNLKTIDDQADANSLAVIDEIGSGTDPTEGGAIAAAFLESLTKRGVFTIATTHHSALKVFAHGTEGVENGAMEFDQVALTPTYRFKAGVPGSSYALEMAQRLGYKEDMLSRSREFMGVQQVKLERLITDLETSSQKYRNELATMQSEKARLDDLIQKYESKIAAQAVELKELRRKAVDEATQIVENANAAIERSIREIKESAGDKEVVRQIREEVKKIHHDLKATRASLPSEATVRELSHLQVGSLVKLKGGVETGEIANISHDRKNAIVLFGNLRMNVAMIDLEKAKKKSGDTRRQVESFHLQPQVTASVLRDIDVRGMTSEEAIPLVDKLIDTAMLAGIHRIDVIHGKGTGALRKKIIEYLSKHPHVKSHRLGEWNEGGTGATVVELTEG